MTLRPVIFLTTIVSIAVALRCHQTPNALTLDKISSTYAQDCPYNSLSCSKVIDMYSGSFIKACGIGNCTAPSGITNLPATCFKYSNNRSEIHSCCCYGDGCNSTPKIPILVLTVTALLIALV